MHKWTDEELKDLENPDHWDTETIAQGPTPNPSARVSIAFNQADFLRLARSAEQRGEDLISFIVTAALERVDRLEVAHVESEGSTVRR